MAQVVTKVKDLIALFLGCDPDGDIKILDSALVYGGAETTGDEYSFGPIVDCLFSTRDGKLSDRIYIGPSDTDTDEALANRQPRASRPRTRTTRCAIQAWRPALPSPSRSASAARPTRTC